MSDAVVLRDASPDEAELILDLWRLAFVDEDAHGDVDDVRRVIAGNSTARVILAERSGSVVGSLIVTFDGWRGHLYRLAVRPEMQRRGIASALVGAAEDWLRVRGCHRVRLTVEPANHGGALFWRSRGYAPDSESFVRRF